VETVEYKNISFTVWDVGGQDKVRVLLFLFFLDHSLVLKTILFLFSCCFLVYAHISEMIIT
jgi:hypothetical protein